MVLIITWYDNTIYPRRYSIDGYIPSTWIRRFFFIIHLLLSSIKTLNSMKDNISFYLLEIRNQKSEIRNQKFVYFNPFISYIEYSLIYIYKHMGQGDIC